MSNIDEATLIVDIGSSTVRAGFAGDDQPAAVFPAVLGKPWVKEGLAPRPPVERGRITSFEHFEAVLRRTFNGELNVAPEDYSLLLSEAPDNSKDAREIITKIAFEKFNFKAFSLIPRPVLSLYASSRTTGMVLSVGDGVAIASPIYEGAIIKDAIMRLDYAGRDLTEYLASLMRGKINSAVAREFYQEMKEKFCYVAMDFSNELTREKDNSFPKRYDLPDGKTIYLEDERYCCPEALFQPSLVGVNAGGVDKLVLDSIMKCNIDFRKDLYANTVLSGGSTMFPGMADRLQKEITNMAPSTMKIKIIAPPERSYSAWIGGSILASIPTFEEGIVLREDYAKQGPGIIHEKCAPYYREIAAKA
jgi:actin-related protein